MDTLEEAQGQNLQTTEEVVEPKPEEVKAEETPKPSQDDILTKITALEKQVSRQQSEKDKAVRNNELTAKELAEVRRENKALKAAMEGLRGDYADDPDFREKLEGHQLRGELQGYKDTEKELRQQGKTEDEHKKFVEDLVIAIQDMGLNPQDPEFNEVAKQITPGDYRGLRKALLTKATEMKARGDKVKDDKYEGLMAEIAKLKKQIAGEANESLPPESKSAPKEWTPESVKGLSPGDLIKHAKDIAKLDLTL